MNFEDSSDSDSDDFNFRLEEKGKFPYNKDLTASMKDFKRMRRQDVNFKSLTREGQRKDNSRKSFSRESQDQESIASPKPCVTYRGGISSNGRCGLLSSSQQYVNGIYAGKQKQ